MRKVAVSVVIPALDEAPNLSRVLPRIPADVHEVILVDGASVDGTIDVARQVMPTIRIVHQEGRGKGSALRSGFAAATGDIIVHLDADGSTDPAEIPAFVGALLAGADYAKGTRFIQGASTTDITFTRRMGNWGLVKLTNLIFRTHFSDITYGYNAVWRHHRDQLAPEIDGWAHEIVGNIRAARNGLRVVEVASCESPRLGGQAKLRTFSAGWTILVAIIAERFRRTAEPARVPFTTGTESEPAAPVQLHLLEVDAVLPESTSALGVDADRAPSAQFPAGLEPAVLAGIPHLPVIPHRMAIQIQPEDEPATRDPAPSGATAV